MLEQFIEELIRRGASTNTINSYAQNVSLFIRWYEQTTGQIFDNKITVFDGREYCSYLNNVQKQKPASINAKLTALQQYANYLYTQGFQEKIKIEKQKAVPVRNIKTLDKPSLYKCRRWVHGYASKRDIAIFELLLNSGIRESELCDLKLDDLQISERKGNLIIRSGKGGKYREISLNSDARTAINDYLVVRPAYTDQHIFLGQRGPLTRNAVYKIVQNIGLKGAGAELSPHMLRHQCFTAMAKSGTDLATIAAIAGHADVKLTASTYVATTAEDRQKAVDGLMF